MARVLRLLCIDEHLTTSHFLLLDLGRFTGFILCLLGLFPLQLIPLLLDLVSLLDKRLERGLDTLLSLVSNGKETVTLSDQLDVVGVLLLLLHGLLLTTKVIGSFLRVYLLENLEVVLMQVAAGSLA